MHKAGELILAVCRRSKLLPHGPPYRTTQASSQCGSWQVNQSKWSKECVLLILLSYLMFSLFSKVHIFSNFITSTKQKLSKSFASFGKWFFFFSSKEWSSASSGKVPFLFLSCRLISFFLNQLPQILFLPSFLSFFLLLTPLFFFSLPHALPPPFLSRNKAGLYLC